jgi:hypothetical protein
MNDAIYTNLVQQIQHNRTWVDVHTANECREFITVSGGVLKSGLFRSIVLICKYPRHGFRTGHKWVIPEFELDKTIHKMQADARFTKRLKRSALSMEDAEHIIRDASFGLINLELEEW